MRSVQPNRINLGFATIALTILAVALRAWHVNHGLPDFTEEAFLFRKALEMWGPGGQVLDLNPHSFVYPSLTLYAHLGLQHVYFLAGGFARPPDFLLSILTDPTGPVVLARWLGIVADAATLLLVGRIAARFGQMASVVAMAVVAFAPWMIATSRLIYTDSVMCALAIAALERTLSYREHGSTRRIVVASVLIGLAAGAKYPAILLLLPLILGVWQREPAGAVSKAWATAGGVALLAFFTTTPYLLVSWAEFTRDITFIGDVTRGGGLGKLGGLGLHYYLAGLAQNVGWLGVGLTLLAALIGARRQSSPAAGLLWLSWTVLLVPVAMASVEAERYLVPLIAVSAVLVGFGAQCVIDRVPFAKSGTWRLGLAALLIAQVVWTGTMVAALGATTTRVEARKWCEANLSGDQLLLSETNGPQLLTHNKKAQTQADLVFRIASPAAQRAYQSRTAYHLVVLPLLVSGHTPVRLPSPGSPELVAHPHAVDWNAAVYDLRLLAGVDFVATSGAVRDRFEMDPDRFAEQRRFYGLLDSLAEVAAEFSSGGGADGPTITIYRMTTAASRAVAEVGPLDSLWWARTIPASFKARADSVVKHAAATDIVPNLPAWAQPLRLAYADRYGQFANDLAENLATLGRLEPAERLGAAALAITPEDVWAAQVYVYVASQLGKWDAIEDRMDVSAGVLARYGPVPPRVLLARAEALSRLARPADAQAVLRPLLQHPDPTVVQAARQRLTQLGTAAP